MAVRRSGASISPEPDLNNGILRAYEWAQQRFPSMVADRSVRFAFGTFCRFLLRTEREDGFV